MTEKTQPSDAQFTFMGQYIKIGAHGLVYKYNEKRGWIRHADFRKVSESLNPEVLDSATLHC